MIFLSRVAELRRTNPNKGRASLGGEALCVGEYRLRRLAGEKGRYKDQERTQERDYKADRQEDRADG